MIYYVIVYQVAFIISATLPPLKYYEIIHNLSFFKYAPLNLIIYLQNFY